MSTSDVKASAADASASSQIVPSEQWPRLSAENNESRIDYSNALNLRLDDANYLPPKLIDRALAALGITIDEKEVLRTQHVGYDAKDILRSAKIDKLREACENFSLNLVIGAENLILTRMIKGSSGIRSYLETSFFVQGLLQITEEYTNNALQRRVIYDNEGGRYEESWAHNRLLAFKGFSDKEDKNIGPVYETEVCKNNYTNREETRLVVAYYIFDKLVNKQAWEEYVASSRIIVKEQPSLNYDVAALINSYTAF